MSKKDELLKELSRELDKSDGAGIDRALAVMLQMHEQTIAGARSIAVEGMARVERQAAENRAFAEGVLSQVMSMRLAVEAPSAAQLRARLDAAAASLASGPERAIHKPSTDADPQRRRGIPEDEDEEIQPVSEQVLNERILAATGDAAAFAGYAPRGPGDKR